MDIKNEITQLEKDLREKDFKIYGFIQAFEEAKNGSLDEFKTDTNCLIHYVNKDDLIRWRDNNLKAKEKIDKKITEQKEQLKIRQESIDEIEARINIMKEQLNEDLKEKAKIWSQIKEIQDKKINFNDIKVPQSLGKNIENSTIRYDVWIIFLILIRLKVWKDC